MIESTIVHPRAGLWVADLDDESVGMVFARIDKTHTLVDFGSMWVSPTARGLGLGSALLEAVKTWARQHDAGILECWVSEGNERAIRLYRNHGLIETNETQLLRGHSSVTVRKMKALLTNHR